MQNRKNKSEYAVKFLMKASNAFFEFKYNIRTRGTEESIGKPGAFGYGTNNYFAIKSILNNLSLQEDDIFVDIGCGKGRVACIAGTLPLRQVIGIEYNKSLCDIALNNIIKLRKCKSQIKILNAGAEECNYDEGTVFYFFNPRSNTMQYLIFFTTHTYSDYVRSIINYTL